MAASPGPPPSDGHAAAELFETTRALIAPGLRDAADRLNPSIRRVVGFHFGWWDEHGRPLDGAGDGTGGGKAVRPTLTLLSAQAVGGPAEAAVPAAVAVELVHDFSLLHDDVMDQDRTRRHRPTAWSVFGVPAAILAGDALLTLAIDLLTDHPAAGTGTGARRLTDTVLRLIDGQTADLAFEQRAAVGVDECLEMAAGKTGALLGCACELGALAGGAGPDRAAQFGRFGEHLGVAFQLVDDLLGIWGDPRVTGKPVMSDLRARKKSLPVVAALAAEGVAAARLAARYSDDTPWDEADLPEIAVLIDRAGGRSWARAEADRRLDQALACLWAARPADLAGRRLAELARRMGRRDR